MILAVFAAVLAPGPAQALQAQRPEVERPRLQSGADTNDATAYYDLGVAQLERAPETAAAAFYWATRLEPSWATALYARRVAGLMAKPMLLVRYLDGDREAIESREAQHLDSLLLRAQRIDPFFQRDFEKLLLLRYIVERVDQAPGRPLEGSERLELEFYLDQALRSVEVSPRLRARIAESQGKLPEALRLYRAALGERRGRVDLHVDLARLFYSMTTYDSALAHLQAAVGELQRRDADRLVRVYESREFFEHASGVVHERRGDVAAAREAYGRALVEQLSYYPAHARLGLVALAVGDTAQALQEMQLAVEVAPDVATIRVTYGVLLAQGQRFDDAVVHLRTAVELEPYYARPYYILGRIAENRQQLDRALESYRAFLARASRGDRNRDAVARRVADLEARQRP